MLQKVKAPKGMSGYGAWPPPVYEAHFDDGTVCRMSFWTEYNKPYNTERARRLFTEGKPLYSDSGCLIAPAPFAGKKLIAGYVEHDIPNGPFVRETDPFFTGEESKTCGQQKKRASIKDARRIVRELLARVDAGNINPELLSEARELIAA